MKDTLMIIGGGVMQLKCIDVAHDMGLQVLVTDQDKNAPGVKCADYFGVASTRDIEQTIAVAKQYAKQCNIRGVITVGTDFSYTVACVAQALSLKGVSPETAFLATNKLAMRRRLKECNVPCPDFIEAHTKEDVLTFAREKGFPVVIKPTDSMGARGVRRIDKPNEVGVAYDQAQKNSYTKTVIVEEYMEGEEVSIDTLVYRGTVYPLTIADRIITFPPYFIEVGHTIPSILAADIQARVVAVMEQGIRALGIDNSPSKGDIKITQEGVKIGEMTVRLSGGFHSQCTDPLATGMNSIKAAIDLAIGNDLDIDDITPRYHHAAAERALLPGFGRIKNIQGIEEAKKMSGVERLILNVKPGDTLYPMTSNMGKAGHVIAHAGTREEAVAIAERAKETVKFVFE